MKVKDLLSAITQLKQFGLLTTPFLKQGLQIIKEQAQTLTTPELVLFVMIYTSSDAKDALPKDSNFEEKLDFILSKHKDQLTAEEFASICNSIALADNPITAL